MRYLLKGFKDNEVRLTKAEKSAVYDTYGVDCYLCGIALNDANKSVDHIHPVFLGGMNNIDNLRPCCRFCNERKSNKLLYNQDVRNMVMDHAIESFHKGVRIPINAGYLNGKKKT